MAFKNKSDEYQRCLKVLSCYSIHYQNISFTCKKYGSSKADLHTTSTSSRLEDIRSIYGQKLSRELLPLEGSLNRFDVQVDGLVSNANWSGKSMHFILFINGRLVDCSSIRKVVSDVYSELLPRGNFPFVYLSLKMPPASLDVNMHPTKNEVGFLYESEVIDFADTILRSCLQSSNLSRTFEVSNPMSALPLDDVSRDKRSILSQTASSAPGGSKEASRTPARTPAPQGKVRVDKDQPQGQLLAYLQHPELSTLRSPSARSSKRARRSECDLTSVLSLNSDMDRNRHEGLSSIFKDHVFVGCTCDEFALIQFNTLLYLVDVSAVTNAFFYERCLRMFGEHPSIKLSSRVSISELCQIALQQQGPCSTEGNEGEGDIAQYIEKLLVSKREMLNEYFSIEISEHGELIALPELASEYEPPMGVLPIFLLRLATEVNWEEERACFETCSREIARFYQVHPGMYLPRLRTSTQKMQSDDGDQSPSLAFIIENVLFPALRLDFTAPRQLLDQGSVVKIASCEKLYKIFERC